MQQEVYKEVDEFLKAYIARTPEAKGLGATAEVRLYKKRPKGFSREPVKVVDALIASAAYRGWTNAQIVASIQARYPGYEVDEQFMERPIPSYLRREIGQMLGANGTRLDLKSCDTLSKIKRALCGDALHRSTDRTYSVTISFADTAVVVDGYARTIFTDAKGYRRIMVGGQQLRVDVLEALVGKPR